MDEMDAIDYYNRGLKMMEEKDYYEAEMDFYSAMYGDSDKIDIEELEGLKMWAYLNHGIALYKQSIGKDIYSNDSIRLTTSAIVDWEHILSNDTNQERIDKASELIEMVTKKRGF
jgi:hypothetical protein